jgi:hypothetical protein
MAAPPITDEAHERLLREAMWGGLVVLLAESADGSIVGLCTYYIA